MRNACSHQGENERQWKKVNRNTYNIASIKSVTRKFLDVSRCSRSKQQQRNVWRKEKRDKLRPLSRVNLTTPPQFALAWYLVSLASFFFFGCHATQRFCVTSKKRLRGRLSTRLNRQTTEMEAIRTNIIIKVEWLWNPLDAFVICLC